MIFPKSDTRSQIISVLSEEFPLSFREINAKLRKNYSIFTSDKPIYRILGLMINEGILIKENNEYSINYKWLDRLDQFKEKITKAYIGGDIPQKNKSKFLSLAKHKCSCGKGYAEGFCFVCEEPVCSECAEKTRMHYDCSEKCEHRKGSIKKCENCQEDVCILCSKEVWTHFSENCTKESEKIVLGILEVDHECWFADLSERTETPIVLNSFCDSRDIGLGTHSGQIIIQSVDQRMVIGQLLKSRQIVEAKPIYMDKQVTIRTRAVFNKSVDDLVKRNKSILLNPIEAYDTKERNLIMSPSLKEMQNLVRILNQFGNCKLIACEEVAINKLNSSESKEISSFVKKVNEEDLNSAVQKMRLMKRFYS
jgi:hypothetical protein